jgi:hypothetical protein
MLDTIQRTLDTALEDDATLGTYRVGRDIFTDPAIFELEMKHIFEGNWIYLAHESQIPDNNDYFTSTMGRQPIECGWTPKSSDRTLSRDHRRCRYPSREQFSPLTWSRRFERKAIMGRDPRCRKPIRFDLGTCRI